jgi:hypothetical protein
VSGHTPGPWFVRRGGVNAPLIRDADARLIAAAPELLKRLREMLRLLDRGPDMKGPVFFAALWAERERVRAAIAKAEGK